ncbi:MAG: hypothetical protein ACR2RF_06295 [Geminicoccaceae bacterium]
MTPTKATVFRVKSSAIIEAVNNFFAGIDGMSHDIQDVWQAGNTVTARLSVTYKLELIDAAFMPRPFGKAH